MNGLKTKFYDVFLSKFVMIIIELLILLSYCYLFGNKTIESFVDTSCIVVSVLVFIAYIFNKKISRFNVYFFIYIMLLIISSYIGKYSTIELAIKTYYKIIALTCLMDLGFKKKCRNTIFSGYFVLSLLIIINFYTIIRYPNGMYESLTYETNWFLGYDNLHICFYFPTLMFMILANKLYGKKIYFLNSIIWLMIAFSVYYCFSANTVVVFTLFMVYLLFSRNIDKIKSLNIKNYFIGYVISFFVIVVARVQNIFSWFVVTVLKKDLTFTGRTKIWDKVMSLIREEWFLGYGKETTAIVTSKLGKLAYTHAHNTILDIFYKGGIIGLVSFFYVLYSVMKQLYKYRDSRIAKVFSMVLLCFFIMMLFEARQEKIGLYIVFITCYNVGEIINLLDNKEEIK